MPPTASAGDTRSPFFEQAFGALGHPGWVGRALAAQMEVEIGVAGVTTTSSDRAWQLLRKRVRQARRVQNWISGALCRVNLTSSCPSSESALS